MKIGDKITLTLGNYDYSVTTKPNNETEILITGLFTDGNNDKMVEFQEITKGSVTKLSLVELNKRILTKVEEI